MAPGATRVSDPPARGQGEIADRPIPAPRAIRVKPIAAVTNAPAITAGHDTPEARLSSARPGACASGISEFRRMGVLMTRLCLRRWTRTASLSPAADHRFARLFGPGGADRGLDVLLLFRRRQNGRLAQHVEPELARPSLRVVQVLVLLVLDFVVGFGERLLLFSVELLGDLADPLPVLVILCLGEDDALRGHDLGRVFVALVARHLDGLDQALSVMPDDAAPRRVLVQIHAQRLEDIAQDLFVPPRLLQVLLPFLLQVIVLRALDGVGV